MTLTFDLPSENEDVGCKGESRFTICSDACPLSCVNGEASSQTGPMHESAGVGKLVNAVLLSFE